MIYWIQYRKAVEDVNNNFEALKPGLEGGNSETQVKRLFQKGYLFSLIPITGKSTLGYEITKGGKSVFLDKETYKLFSKKYSEADKMHQAFVNAHEISKKDLNNTNLYRLRTVLNSLAVLAFVALGFVAVFTLTDKNYSSETKKIANASELKEGDYVELNGVIIDSYQITTTTTRRGSTKESASNLYSFALVYEANKPNSDGGVMIIKSKPSTTLTKDILNAFNNAGIDELVTVNKTVTGEVKKVSQIEKLDQKEQVTDYFKETSDALEVEPAKYFIDTGVERVNFAQAIMPTALTFAASLALLIGAILVSQKIKTRIKEFYSL